MAEDPRKPPRHTSAPDLSQFADKVDIPSRKAEHWFAVILAVLLAFAIGIFIALR